MNEFLEIIRNRRSIRKFEEKAIENDKIDAILEAGRWAPSFANTQPWEFIVIKDKKIKEELVIATAHDSIAQAPTSIVVIVNPEIDRLHHIEDGAVATQNMALAAYSLGLGCFWVGVLNTGSEIKIKEILGIPETYRVISILPIGYPAEFPKKGRKKLKEIVHYEKYGKKL
ncbi:MAG: nitroreductase family protein [Candidatus Bathyarchaeia archaeon]